MAALACVSATHVGTPRTCFMAPKGASPKAPVAPPACGRHSVSAHPSSVSLPRRELHRRPQWHRPHAAPLSMSAHPSHVSRPLGSSTEGPSGTVRMRSRRPFRDTPHTVRGPTWGATEGFRGPTWGATEGFGSISVHPSAPVSRWGGLGASWSMLEAILSDLGVSWAILEVILGSRRPSWSHLGPSWTL